MFRRKESVAGGYCANDALISAIKPNASTLHQSDSRSNRIVLRNVIMVLGAPVRAVTKVAGLFKGGQESENRQLADGWGA